jgi:hypothetical protein
VEFRNSIQALQGSKDEFSAHEYSKEKNTAKKMESISNCLPSQKKLRMRFPKNLNFLVIKI